MSLRHAHVPAERLAVLALAGADDERGADDKTLAHVSTCDLCAAELSRLATDFDRLREEAFHEADALFPEAALETQRARVLDRLAHIGHAARVLPFPMRRALAGPANPVVNRRWVSAAAVAGLLVGIAAGQVMHVGSWGEPRQTASADSTAAVSDYAPSEGVAQALATVPASAPTPLAYYVGLTEVDSADQLGRAAAIRPLDALTPAPVYIP